jgi:CHAT domain-containing protein/Flp pilus assembly protein TadD
LAEGAKTMFQMKRWVMTILIICLLLSDLSDIATAQDRESQLAEAKQLNAQAFTLYNAGRYNEAVALLERALAIREKVFGNEDPAVAKLLNNLGAVYDAQGDYARAESSYLRALAIQEKALNAEYTTTFVRDVAQSLDNLAGLYRTKGDYARAEPMHLRALAITEKEFGPEDPDVARALYNLAALYDMKGDYARAEPLYLRALAIREKVLETAHSADAVIDATNTIGHLASLYSSKGDYIRAETLYLRGLVIEEKELGVEHPNVAASLNNLASLYQARGEYGRAEPLLLRALAIKEKGLGATHPSVAVTLNNLAVLYAAQGDYARAEPLHLRALAIQEKIFGATHPYVATTLSNLAGLYRAKGDYARSKLFQLRALAITEKALGAEHPNVATMLSNLAVLYDADGNHIQAVQSLSRGSEIREHNLDLILAIGSENQKQLYLNTYSGEAHGAVSLHIRSAPQDTLAAQLALTAILRWKGRVLDAMIDQIGILRRHATPQDQTLLDHLATARSQLATLQISNGTRLSPEAQQAEATRLRAEVERLEGEVSLHSAQFRTQTQPITLDAICQAIPVDAALVEIFAYQPFVMKAKSFVEWGTAHYVAYVVRHHETVPQWVELGEATTIDAESERLRAALKDPKRTDVQTIARALDERVMRPIRKLLGPTRRIFLSPDGSLNLIPFAALVDENGNYLIEKYSITYLTSGRDLLRLQAQAESRSASMVVADPLYDMSVSRHADNHADQSPPRSDESRRSVDFKRLNYTPLPGTAEEAAVLSKLWPDARVLTQERATEAALKQVNSPRILHIATHGFFLPDQTQALSTNNTLRRETFNTFGSSPLPAVWENPLLRSGLVLAGVKQGQSGVGEDGVLTALEAAGLNLWGTKLVVLSACETGLGGVQKGAGVYGLRRALVLAGSESQVMSLWKVSDVGTRDLMTAYYTRLQKGEGRTEALRQVQLEMLSSQMSSAVSDRKRETSDTGQQAAARDYRHPYYWAAFIQSGDWRSLTGQER